jgi:WD40 repeat protein
VFRLSLLSGLVMSSLLPAAGPPLLRLDRYGDPLPSQAIARLGTTRFCTNRRVAALAVSPDGKTIASVCFSDSASPPAEGKGVRTSGIFLWETSTGRVKKEIPLPEITYGLTFSPDSRMLALASDQSVILLDVVTGKKVRTLATAHESLRSLAFLPDGRTLALAEQLSKIHFWDTRTGKRTRLVQSSPPVETRDRSVSGFHIPTLSPNGKVVAWTIVRQGKRKTSDGWVSTHSETLQIRDVETGSLRCAIPTRGLIPDTTRGPLPLGGAQGSGPLPTCSASNRQGLAPALGSLA